MSDGQRNATDAERAAALLAGQTGAFCRHGQKRGKCMECAAPEMLAMLRELQATYVRGSELAGDAWMRVAALLARLSPGARG